jgi:hypothetical protein
MHMTFESMEEKICQQYSVGTDKDVFLPVSPVRSTGCLMASNLSMMKPFLTVSLVGTVISRNGVLGIYVNTGTRLSHRSSILVSMFTYTLHRSPDDGILE